MNDVKNERTFDYIDTVTMTTSNQNYLGCCHVHIEYLFIYHHLFFVGCNYPSTSTAALINCHWIEFYTYIIAYPCPKHSTGLSITCFWETLVFGICFQENDWVPFVVVFSGYCRQSNSQSSSSGQTICMQTPLKLVCSWDSLSRKARVT